MLIHSNDSISTTKDEEFDDKDICLICYGKMEKNDNLSILKCNHRYHYNCIYLTYKNLKNKRECPYCRSDGGYISLPEGRVPEKHIHKEYLEYRKGNTSVVKLIEGRCKYILKKGKNAGYQCSFKSKCDSGYCVRHNNMIEKEKADNLIIELSKALA